MSFHGLPSLQGKTLQKSIVAFINIIDDSPDQPVMRLRNMKWLHHRFEMGNDSLGKTGRYVKNQVKTTTEEEVYGI